MPEITKEMTDKLSEKLKHEEHMKKMTFEETKKWMNVYYDELAVARNKLNEIKSVIVSMREQKKQKLIGRIVKSVKCIVDSAYKPKGENYKADIMIVSSTDIAQLKTLLEEVEE